MRAKLFKNGNCQALRLPKEFRFEGTEVEINRVDGKVVVTPIRPDWSDFFAMDTSIWDGFEDRDQGIEQEREFY